jgi:RecJ-like exonuclease
MMMRRSVPTVYSEDGGETELPLRWEICCHCDGHGTDRGASVECDGGGFTASEWAEQDHDFREDYLAGYYDRTCEACCGSGKVEVVDEDRCTSELWSAWQQQCEDLAAERAMERAERRMGC